MTEAAQIGKYAFILGAILAVVAAVVPTVQAAPWLLWALVALGLVVGLLNITEKETTSFLVASIALMLTGQVAGTLGTEVSLMVGNIALFVAPAALIVALKAIYDLARD